MVMQPQEYKLPPNLSLIMVKNQLKEDNVRVQFSLRKLQQGNKSFKTYELYK